MDRVIGRIDFRLGAQFSVFGQAEMMPEKLLYKPWFSVWALQRITVH